MTRAAALALALLLAACGADGPPVPPSEAREDLPEAETGVGVTLGGSVSAGVSGRF